MPHTPFRVFVGFGNLPKFKIFDRKNRQTKMPNPSHRLIAQTFIQQLVGGYIMQSIINSKMIDKESTNCNFKKQEPLGINKPSVQNIAL